MKILIHILFFTILSTFLQAGDHSSEINKLLRKQRLIQGKVPQVSRLPRLEKDKELLSLREKAAQLAEKLNTTRRNHPALKKHYATHALLKKRLAEAKKAKDKEAARETRLLLQFTTKTIITTAKTIPELRQIRKEIAENDKQIYKVEKKILRVNDAEKKQVDDYITMGKMIDKLRKQKPPVIEPTPDKPE